MEVNEARNCLVIDIVLHIRKSAGWIRKPNCLTLREL